ncbi:unnamed protein product [Prorocentrum cordatum]|nr:unnamed protein product [Polarella glacialis]
MLPALVGTPRRRIIAHRVPVDSTRGAFGTSESIFLPFFLSHSSSTRESACLWDAGAQPEVAATQRCCPQRGRAVLSPAADEGRGGLSSQVVLGLMFFTYDCSVLAETRSACMDFELVSPFSRHWCFIRLGFARGELK